MNVQAFLEASVAVQVHAALGILAFALGTYVLLRRKGGPGHRRLGRVWLALMVGVALSAMFIHHIRTWGPFSMLHLLVPWTLGSCWYALHTARRRRFVAHASTMIGLYLGALVVAGGLTFLPGRLMHRVFLQGTYADLARMEAWPLPPVWVPILMGLIAFVLVGFLPVRRWVATVRPSGR